ncbi:dGTP triphosphohydrolase [Rhodocaloribacter sp.]
MLYSDSDYKRERPIQENPRLDQEKYRSAFWRDYARLIHSASFRRLQGKTQLFPGIESDYFRNRLTHSLEVAQIAKSIARRINSRYSFSNGTSFNIDTDLIEFAALAHDLGHPPFGHVGEAALDERMASYGGFEGNAQTLRILARLEKKDANHIETLGIDENGTDCRYGLNLTYRSLASVLKYDTEIPCIRDPWDSVTKGYYGNEAALVSKIKMALTGDSGISNFKTLECNIMDVADDIAYSTYDLEDSFKAGFLRPISLLSASDEVAETVARRVEKHWKKTYTANDVKEALYRIFREFIVEELYDEFMAEPNDEGTSPEEDLNPPSKDQFESFAISLAAYVFGKSEDLARNTYHRTKLTSRLVGTFVRGIRVDPNDDLPLFSRVYLADEVREYVEVLKHFIFVSQIESPRLKIVEYRGKEIIKTLFDTLNGPGGDRLLPSDYRQIYERVNDSLKKRIICDYIAGMTDRYAFELYGRISSERAQTIFKPT